MKNYLIVENSGSAHEEGVKTIAIILKNEGFNVELLLSDKNSQRATVMNIEKYVDKVISHGLICSLIYIVINRKKYNAIVFNTVSVRNTIFTFSASLFSRSNIYVVQNANSWLKYCWHKSSLLNIVFRNLSTFFKKLMILKAKGIIVENSAIKKYLIMNNITRVDVIPFIIPDPESLLVNNYRKNKNEKLIFTVPGVIDFEKKDIEKIVNAFIELSDNELKKVKLILLGPLRSNIENEQCKTWKFFLTKSFEYYTDFIPTPEFNKVIIQSDFIISSFKEFHKCKHLFEIYSKTKGSGVDAHAISNSLPLIVNRSYCIDKKYESSTIKFNDSADLLIKIKELIENNAMIKRLKLNASENSKLYSLENIRSELKYLC